MKSKGGDFITKKTNYQSVFVPEQWNEEQIMLKEMIFDFLNKEIHSLDKEHEASKDLPKSSLGCASIKICSRSIFKTPLLVSKTFN